MQYLEYTYTRKKIIVHLKFKFTVCPIFYLAVLYQWFPFSLRVKDQVLVWSDACVSLISSFVTLWLSPLSCSPFSWAPWTLSTCLLQGLCTVVPSAWNSLPSQRVTVSPSLTSSGGDDSDGGLVTEWCLTLCDPMDCSLPAPLSVGFPRQEYWRRLPFPSLLASSSSVQMPSFQWGLSLILSELLLTTCCQALSLFGTLFFL